MKTIVVNNFARGITEDRYAGRAGEYSVSKHFDILTYPNRLQPLRGMTTDTASTGIGNMIVSSSDGLMYGTGLNASNGRLWQRSGYGGADVWQHVPTNDQLSGAVPNYDFLVEFKDCGHVRTIHWASANLLVASDPAGGSSASTQALTYSSIGQGLVHPKDKVLYFPYRTSSASYIGKISSNATVWTGLSATAFTLPSQYRAYCLSYWGNYLAIPLTLTTGNSFTSSIVALWNRDTSLTTFDETIPWGTGNLKVLNNLSGALIGISSASANDTSTIQDYDAIYIKAYTGGAEPILIKEIKAQHLASGSSQPVCTINPRVNFIQNNRLYFSIDVTPSDGTPAYHGLWSVGRNKLSGEYTVVLERMATTDSSETSVIAAAINGDFVDMVHTAAGTLTATINGTTSASTYGATSLYESLVNPEMDALDKMKKKKLHSISVRCQPLPTSGQIVLKYRVDSTGLLSDWVTARTYTTAGGMGFEAPKPTSGFYTDGYNYEFRLESTGGAVITSFAYKYENLETNI